MQRTAFSLLVLLSLTAIPLSAGAVPAQAERQAVSAQQTTRVADRCPPDYYWEESSYAPHGKFRVAHCAPR
jgi:hypothetical protein